MKTRMGRDVVQGADEQDGGRGLNQAEAESSEMPGSQTPRQRLMEKEKQPPPAD